MAKSVKFGRPEIADSLKQQFGQAEKSINRKLKYQTEVKEFIQKIEKAHKEAEKSNLFFG